MDSIFYIKQKKKNCWTYVYSYVKKSQLSNNYIAYLNEIQESRQNLEKLQKNVCFFFNIPM